MKYLVIAALTMLLVESAAAAIAEPPQKPAQVHGQGCVEPGIEARCLVVRDLKSGKRYDLLIKGLPPAIGEGIEFVGVPHEGPNICMQGIALDVIGWARRDSLRCKQGPAHQK